MARTRSLTRTGDLTIDHDVATLRGAKKAALALLLFVPVILGALLVGQRVKPIHYPVGILLASTFILLFVVLYRNLNKLIADPRFIVVDRSTLTHFGILREYRYMLVEPTSIRIEGRSLKFRAALENGDKLVSIDLPKSITRIGDVAV